jgi:hypothetical protein
MKYHFAFPLLTAFTFFFKFIDKTIYTGNVWVYVLSVGRRRIKGQRKRKSHEKDQSIFNNNKLRVTPQYYT